MLFLFLILLLLLSITIRKHTKLYTINIIILFIFISFISKTLSKLKPRRCLSTQIIIIILKCIIAIHIIKSRNKRTHISIIMILFRSPKNRKLITITIIIFLFLVLFLLLIIFLLIIKQRIYNLLLQ